MKASQPQEPLWLTSEGESRGEYQSATPMWRSGASGKIGEFLHGAGETRGSAVAAGGNGGIRSQKHRQLEIAVDRGAQGSDSSH
jgi:hypothetical protein